MTIVSDAIGGRKIRLRPLADSDAPALVEAMAASRAELKRRFRWASTPWPEDGASLLRRLAESAAGGQGRVLAVAEAKSDRLVGAAALRGATIPEGSCARISLWIRTDRAGRGYATEAGRLLVEIAFRRMDLHRIHARIDPTNRPSRKVLQKLGFRYEGCLREHKRLNGRWVDQECWGLLKSEWKK